jgi:hypothetical protein
MGNCGNMCTGEAFWYTYLLFWRYLCPQNASPLRVSCSQFLVLGSWFSL